MTLLTILSTLQQEDIRSVNSTWLIAIVLIGCFLVGLIGGWAKGKDGPEGGDTP